MAIVLVVDDVDSMRQMIVFTSKNAGLNTIKAFYGLNAMTKATIHASDLVLADANMSRMDGTALL